MRLKPVALDSRNNPPGINDSTSATDVTTVDQPKRDMAVQAVDMLRDKIENGTQGYVHQILLPTLIQRGTCRKLEPSK